MNEEAAIREQIRVAGDVLPSLAQRLAGTIFLLEAAGSAMNQGEVLSDITQASKLLPSRQWGTGWLGNPDAQG